MTRNRVKVPIVLEPLLFLCLSAVMGIPAIAQTVASPAASSADVAPPSIQFDAVSIKLNKSGESRMAHSFPANGDSMSFTNIPLFVVMMYLYNADRPGNTTGLPDWAKTERYDITAKVTGPDVAEYLKLNQAQRKLMLQKVLEDRFKLQFHREQRPRPVYELVIAKSGPRMQSAQPGDVPANGRTVLITGQGEMTGRGATLEDLAYTLSDSGMDRQVLNKSGLAGRYNFSLHYSINQSAEMGPGGTPDNSVAAETAPSIFAAIQEQLGLKLEPATAPVECLVIDHVERPSEN